MNPKDIVAIILAIAVAVILIATSSLKYLYVGDNYEVPTAEVLQPIENILNVIIGALSGYIAGKASN